MPRPTLMIDTWAWIALCPSYTDCTTLAVMQQRNITTVFTGDEHFQILGFTIRQ